MLNLAAVLVSDLQFKYVKSVEEVPDAYEESCWVDLDLGFSLLFPPFFVFHFSVFVCPSLLYKKSMRVKFGESNLFRKEAYLSS